MIELTAQMGAQQLKYAPTQHFTPAQHNQILRMLNKEGISDNMANCPISSTEDNLPICLQDIPIYDGDQHQIGDPTAGVHAHEEGRASENEIHEVHDLIPVEVEDNIFAHEDEELDDVFTEQITCGDVDAEHMAGDMRNIYLCS
ncbi:hypothetical protein K7X08_019526 [Anisodus acutangulus]|uniref:Uncharacterized protein n=1 Tax=Anisodus acutangulus TaxID=402998 RepID=A0A9Q1MVD8_9SOLA|nr:hypothetical protein K7X08_019526 [Anisodus acutangulus]